VRLPLDTHSFLWFIMGRQELSERARSLIEDEANERLFSTAILWGDRHQGEFGETHLGRALRDPDPRQLAVNAVHVLDIGLAHLATVSTLPFHHRDPFDRLLAAQCTVENLPIVSVDPAFHAYGVQRLW